MTMGDERDRGGSDQVVELSARLLFSLLRSAARLAARFDLPLDRLVELTQLAYFQEIRRDAPRDMGRVARKLGVSLRTAGSLSKKMRGDFLAPEVQVQKLRKLTGILLDGPLKKSALLPAMTDGDSIALERALKLLEENDWLSVSGQADDPTYALKTTLRSFVSDDLNRRIDGLNHQLDILTASIQQRFLAGNDKTARARSWFFAARDEDIPGFIEETVKDLRHGAIDLEEAALKTDTYKRYGVTIAITPVGEEK
jgi:hypothetical protein